MYDMSGIGAIALMGFAFIGAFVAGLILLLASVFVSIPFYIAFIVMALFAIAAAAYVHLVS